MEENMEMLDSNIARVFGRTCWIVCSLLFLYGCQASSQKVPYYFTPDLSPVWGDVADLPEDPHTIKPFTFTNQNSKDFGSAQLNGKVYVANFFFTSCPSICPKMTTNLKTVSERFGGNEEVQIVSFSVTPERDSVAVLKRYHSRFDMGDNWNLLTGDKEEIYTLARKSYYIEERFGLSAKTNEFLHTERCILIDKLGHIRGVYNATVALDMERIISDIEILLDNK